MRRFANHLSNDVVVCENRELCACSTINAIHCLIRLYARVCRPLRIATAACWDSCRTLVALVSFDLTVSDGLSPFLRIAHGVDDQAEIDDIEVLHLQISFGNQGW